MMYGLLDRCNSPQQIQPSEMQGMAESTQQSMVGYFQPVQSFHNHPLANQSQRASKMPRMGEQGNSSSRSLRAPSVVGLEGMPQPAPRPRYPRLRFTPEDDQLLVDLKENKSLTWGQLAEFFPGRSSGTLQVRYCTKLKTKTARWTDETVSPKANHSSRILTFS